MSITRVAVVVGLAWALASAPAAQAQTASPLTAGLELYAAASYDEALAALEAARQLELTVEDRIAIEHHRMLCLLALGRSADADEAAASLLQTNPAFTLSASDASPRVRAMFDQTRRRVLPAVVRRVYSEAKQAYDGGDYAIARDGFAEVGQLLADPQVAAADPAFGDLRTLADGFAQLSAAAVDRRSTRPDFERIPAAPAVLPPPTQHAFLPARAAVAPATPALEAGEEADEALAVAPEPRPAPVAPSAPTPASTHAVSPPFAPIGIFTYDWRDKDVAPPVALQQAVSGWWGSMGEPPAGTPLGALDVLVDETGRVVEARIHQSVNRVYDAVLLESVEQWRYRPATKDGRPVKYRRVTGVVSGR